MRAEPEAPPKAPPRAPEAPPLPPAPQLPEYTPPIWEVRVPPEESGLPPSPEPANPFQEMLRDLGYSSDPYAATYLWYGWYDRNITSDERVRAREQFFRYTNIDEHNRDFWDQWREWYSETAA